MCEIVENIFKNIEDIENQSISLREQLFQAETELAQVVAATRRSDEEAATLDSDKDRMLVEVNQKEVQFEILVQKEEAVKKTLSLKKEELNLEKNKVEKLQDEIFTQRTEFCNKVWEFSDYIVAEKKKNDHIKQKDDENVHEETLRQLEEKKSAMEAQLDKTNTKLNDIMKKLQETTAEKEELESYTNSEEYLDLERKLQSVVEENKILEKAVDPLITTVDHIHKGKTENKQLEVIGSTNTHTESMVSSRKKVSYYCYETVEERAMHTTQRTSSINSSVHLNDSPYKLQSDVSEEQRDFPKSFYHSPQKVMSDVHYIEESGDGGIQHPDIARKLRYPGMLYKKNLHGYSDQIYLMPPLSKNSNSNPKNGDFKTANRNSNNQLQLSNLGILQEGHYPPNINGGEMKSLHAYTDQTYNADKYRRIYHPSVGSSHNIPAFPVHNPQDSYQHYEAPNSVRDKPSGANVRNYYKDNDTESAKHYRALKSPNTRVSYGHSLSQEQSPYYGACRPDQGGYGRETWPPPWHDKTPWLSPRKKNDYYTHGTALEGVRNEDTQIGNRNWPCDEQAHGFHQPEYANCNLGNSRECYRTQQTSFGPSQRPASYPQWHGVEGDNAINTTANFPNSRGTGYHQLPVNEANLPCNPGESSKESNKSGYAGTWRPKVRVAKQLRALGKTNSHNMTDNVQSREPNLYNCKKLNN